MTIQQDNRPTMHPTEPEATFRITSAYEGHGPVNIRANYVKCDEERYPGWTLLKNGRHQVVAMVRSDAAHLIQRIDDDQDGARA